jgi:exopolyphosphatase/guanosine-5'-triphosphate,3'-diphosphate pyrophosphatase
VLGFPIDVISGREEARLIYQGVAHLLPQSGERRLVVDIGGRSTELILGQGLDARVMESFRVGSVAWSMKYFPDGQFTPQSFQMAEIAAKAVLDEALNAYRREAWDVAYGSSGTIGAVGDVLAAAGWPADDRHARRPGLAAGPPAGGPQRRPHAAGRPEGRPPRRHRRWPERAARGV